MKHGSIAGLGALALIASISFSGQIPVVANLFSGESAIAQNSIEKGQVQLNLQVEKKVIKTTANGERKVSWETLKGKAQVQPGDVLRYRVNGGNNGDKAVKNLAINQPIPEGMEYVLKSATVEQNKGAKITYSIDGGKTFVENPTVKVKLENGEVETRPAPAEAYTHARWNFGESVGAKSSVEGSVQVTVK
ncbi:hypothetical protein BC008_45125 [Mastigocoleus testarum BC008]|uniref:DUF11 domain-containing protein n=1 Tax=Mastigocoleus testarum BC008 TaxID=371196 RepID=A0A0V8A126_9CYAN|nr:hypothetical protein BC008_45125 [Mastigocoleus testarum BC008]